MKYLLVCLLLPACAHDTKVTTTSAKGVVTVTETSSTPSVPLINGLLTFLGGMAGAMIPHSQPE